MKAVIKRLEGILLILKEELRKTAISSKRVVKAVEEGQDFRSIVEMAPSIIGDDDTIGPPFFMAVRKNRVDLVAYFIEAGVNVNIIGFCRSTLAICAVENNNAEILKLLISAGADLNVVDGYGKTALIEAVRLENVEMVKILLEARVNVNIRGSRTNAISVAFKSQNKEIIDRLLYAGAWLVSI